MIASDEQYDLAFPRVLEGIAQGATRNEVYDWVGRVYSALSASERTQLLTDALDQALAQGVEREDIDSSWF